MHVDEIAFFENDGCMTEACILLVKFSTYILRSFDDLFLIGILLTQAKANWLKPARLRPCDESLKWSM